MIKVVPSLGFTGQCNQAIEMYKEAFNAKVKEKVLFADAGQYDFKCKDEEKDYVFYSELIIGNQIFALADDSMDMLEGKQPAQSCQTSLLMHFESDDALHKAYSILSNGAKILAPIHGGAYFSAYAVLQDKFGICWELMSGYSDYSDI